jgi:hypothetical protein
MGSRDPANVSFYASQILRLKMLFDARYDPQKFVDSDNRCLYVGHRHRFGGTDNVEDAGAREI